MATEGYCDNDPTGRLESVSQSKKGIWHGPQYNDTTD